MAKKYKFSMNVLSIYSYSTHGIYKKTLCVTWNREKPGFLFWVSKPTRFRLANSNITLLTENSQKLSDKTERLSVKNGHEKAQ